MSGHVQRIELPGGAVVHARLSAPGGGYGEDEEDVGFVESATARVRQLEQLIAGVGSSVLAAASAARPDEAAVSFGIELTAKSGVALAVLAAGEAKASVQVTLVWYRGEQNRPEGLDDSPAGAPSDARSGPSGTPAAPDTPSGAPAAAPEGDPRS
ncbi:CU044_2847 family protein [Streptomyces clavuligerus]|uniref:Trypsin-co-occurring domain-containing protein n=1 Tax=Streptomyces clavuligerus TaxID=1901 RepID=E2Q5I9_STRCL|nr:CU044_2847 family protein [Streptomyces clavuligerus]ANW18195.1 hypothetical protein BB341_08125 [Streptomyces clavuligerus]AXU12757.1 hypothetical protein D1794_08435 [Streptomyces clavuligerus]EFG09203.1 Hypothetical protein SCLAV_4128 [Streptomyces clavuligerus]MBY6302664.1 hypothetical protein [Streptomyces clavuligerus]QCS05540.1 hypothetical protein CRV15_07860 [Streptomyces clavuligerus]